MNTCAHGHPLPVLPSRTQSPLRVEILKSVHCFLSSPPKRHSVTASSAVHFVFWYDKESGADGKGPEVFVQFPHKYDAFLHRDGAVMGLPPTRIPRGRRKKVFQTVVWEFLAQEVGAT